MSEIEEWVEYSIKLLRHAEEHHLKGETFDLGVAFVYYDDAIEVSIQNFYTNNPADLGNIISALNSKKTRKKIFDTCFPFKIEVFEEFCKTILHVSLPASRDDIEIFHRLRNKIYHEGKITNISESDLIQYRKISVKVLSLLANLEIEKFLSQRLAKSTDVVVPEAHKNLSPEIDVLGEIVRTRLNIFEILKSLDITNATSPLELDLKDSWDKLLSVIQDVPSSYKKSIAKTYDLREKLLAEEELSSEEEAGLETIAKELGSISEFLDKKLRDFQKEMAEKAIKWVTTAISNKDFSNIGVVHQATGTGRSLVILSTIFGLLSNKNFNDYKFILVTDRIEICDHFDYFFSKQSPNLMPNIALPRNTHELMEAFARPTQKVVITTVQSLMQTKSVVLEQRKFVLIIDNIHTGYIDNLQKRYPNSLKLLFTSGKANIKDLKKATEVSRYNLLSGIRDGLLIAPLIEVRNVAWEPLNFDFNNGPRELGDYQDDISSFNKTIWSDRISRVADDLINHFERRSIDQTSKGAILSPNREADKLMYERIISCRPEWEKRIVLFPSGDATNDDYNRYLLDLFSDPTSEINLVIGGNLLFTGIDIPTLNTVYILRHLTTIMASQIMGKIMRSSPGKKDALIVDYWDNQHAFVDLFQQES